MQNYINEEKAKLIRRFNVESLWEMTNEVINSFYFLSH